MKDAATHLARPSVFRLVLFLFGIGLCAVSQWYIFQRIEWYWSSWGLVIGAFVTALAIGAPRAMRAFETRPLSDPPPSRGSMTLGSVLSLAGLAMALLGTWLLSAQWVARFEWGMTLVVVGATVWSLGLARLDHHWRKDATPLPWLRWEMVAFLAILVLGLFLRFYRFGEFPPLDGICAIEEPQSGQGAVAIREGERPWEFFFDRWIAVPFMAWYGDTFTAIRIPFAIVSWLTIIPLYLLLRELVSRPAALSATLLFAFCRWHLAYARHAHNIFGPTLPLILFALYLSVRAYRRGGLSAYPWIGLICAYTLYAYAGYRGTTAFIGLFFAISLAQHAWEWRRAVIPSARLAIRTSLRGQLVGALLALIGFSLLVVPLYYRLSAQDPTYFLEAANRATNNPNYYHDDTKRMLEQRLERVRETAAMFNHHGDGSGVFNMPGTPQLDPVSGTLLVLGLVYCIVWARRRMQGYFALYFLMLLAFGTVFVHNFDIRRLQGIIPLIFILIAFFLDAVGGFTRKYLGKAAWVPLALGGTVLGGIAFADNYRIYFKEMMSSQTVTTAFHTEYTIAIRYFHDMPEDGYLQLISDMNNFFLPSDYDWWRGHDRAGAVSHDLWPLFSGAAGPWKDRELHVLIRLPMFEGEEIAAIIEKRFPDVRCSEYRHPDGPDFATFTACRIRSHSDGKELLGGLRARYFRDGVDGPFLERDEPVLSYAFFPDACLYPNVKHIPPCRADWNGTWQVEKAGSYEIMVTARTGRVQLRIDGRPIASTLESSYAPGQVIHTRLELEPGAHQVEVESKFNSLEQVGTRFLVRGPGESRWRLLEFAPPTDAIESADDDASEANAPAEADDSAEPVQADDA